jgi:agmatine deiminase
MITGRETNTVGLSEKIFLDTRFRNTALQLSDILKTHGVRIKKLRATKDIWCRDYMPIQVGSNEFTQFRYEPSYLQDELELQSDPIEVCQVNGIEPKFSQINLDGGNVVNWTDKAILTDRVFDENPEYRNKTKLIDELENLLQAQVIIIPQIKSDMTGHADGMVRFIDQNTILGNSRKHEYKYWRDGINKVLKEKGLTYIDIPFLDHKEPKHPDHAIGCYVNYLEVQDLIILPVFEVDNNKDEEVIQLFTQIFPDRKIETINYNDIGLFGGLLNCTTWTIKE